MRIEREFTVAAPLQRAWGELLDVEDLAACVPAAQLSRLDGENVYGGDVTLEVGDSKIGLRGTLRPVDADDDEHVASVRVRGREIAGPAIGAGTIESRLAGENGSTRVKLSADLRLTGQRADDDAVERVAGELLDQFARRLEKRILERKPEPRAVAPEPGPSPAGTAAGAAKDRLPSLGTPALASGAGLLVLLLLALLGRRRKRFSLTISYRW
jgi:carbon monoxide dehydrogenase subunit G